MKNTLHNSCCSFLILSILFFNCFDSVCAQQGFTPQRSLDSRAANAMTDLKNRVSRKQDTPKNVKGSYYFSKNFVLSKVVYFGKELKEKAYLRYNAANDEIEMGKNSSQKDSEEILLRSSQVDALINNEYYKFLNHKSRNKNIPIEGYLIVLTKNKKYSLFMKKKKVYMKEVKAQTSLQRSSPARFISSTSYFYSVDEKTPSHLKVSKTNLFKIFEGNSKPIKTFIKDKKLKIKKTEDLIQIFDYASSLD